MNPQPGHNGTDRELVRRLLQGDRAAFALIIQQTEALVAQIVCRLIERESDRQDLAQDIYLKVFHHLAGFAFQSKLSTWIAQIAYNTCFSYLEKKKLRLTGDPARSEYGIFDEEDEPHGESAERMSPAEQSLFEKERSAIVAGEIRLLPPVYRTLIVLYHQEEFSYEEMASVTGLPVGTVKNYMFRARKMLREKLLHKYKREAL